MNWDHILVQDGCRWFHTGGIFAALAETTPSVAQEALESAKRHGVVVSYDLNYRASLWKSIGGSKKAHAVNAELVRLADVVFANAAAFSLALRFVLKAMHHNFSMLHRP